MSSPTVTAFQGHEQLASGPLYDVARVAWQAITNGGPAGHGVLVFDDATGCVIDLEMRGDERAMLAHLSATMPAYMTPVPTAEPAEADSTPRARGRPRLGVVAREITLLPRHWEWLATQPGGASVALRKLVDAARHTHAMKQTTRRARSRPCTVHILSDVQSPLAARGRTSACTARSPVGVHHVRFGPTPATSAPALGSPLPYRRLLGHTALQ